MIKIRNLTLNLCVGEFLMTQRGGKDVVEILTLSVISESQFTPTVNISMCNPLVIPMWNPLLGFNWKASSDESRCGVFLRNLDTYRDHLPLDIIGGWHLWTSPQNY